jgi:hypothetical protein
MTGELGHTPKEWQKRVAALKPARRMSSDGRHELPTKGSRTQKRKANLEAHKKGIK